MNASTLVVAVSQSGKSAETVRLLEMNARRAKIIGVTNWADSPLAREADFAVMTAAGDEYTVSCKTYVTTHMALRALGAVLSGADVGARVAGDGAVLRRYFASTSAIGRGTSDELAETAARRAGRVPCGARRIAGRGADRRTDNKESTHFHAEGMSSAAFRHGPFEMLKAGIFVGVFGGDAKHASLNDGLIKDL